MRAALDHLHFDPGQLAASSTLEQEPILLGTNLRDLLLKRFKAKSPLDSGDQSALDATPLFAPDQVGVHGSSDLSTSVLFDDQRLYSWALRYQRANPLVLDGDPVFDLNKSQVMAIACMLGNRLSLIQGVINVSSWRLFHSLTSFIHSRQARARVKRLLRL